MKNFNVIVHDCKRVSARIKRQVCVYTNTDVILGKGFDEYTGWMEKV